MEINVVASTKLGHISSKEEVLELAGKMSNICYTKRTAEDIFNEDSNISINRAKGVIKNGHHSVSEHPRYNYVISDIPKILAMVLNNEGVYTTSEKSARYTKMKPTAEEQEKYNKWLQIFSDKIKEEYEEKFVLYNTKFPPKKKTPEEAAKIQIEKLAQENARYMLSVFTPTILGHSIDARQLSYIRIWFENFIQNAEDTMFNKMLKPYMSEFVEKTREQAIDEIEDKKNRTISMFDSRESRQEFFNECYSINYKGSFAELAQAQRHRTLRYTMKFLKEPEFYVPLIIRNNEKLVDEWLSDISSLVDRFPQGMLVMINERGTYEDFIQKCSERLCGCAQLEIALQTKKTLDKYIENVKETNKEVYDILLPYSRGARCMNGWHCAAPCVWGAKETFTRKV